MLGLEYMFSSIQYLLVSVVSGSIISLQIVEGLEFASRWGLSLVKVAKNVCVSLISKKKCVQHIISP